MTDESKKLNNEQLEAVEHGSGPLLIIAGAGTGKTTVITERVKYLVTSEKALASEILALTFTEKAALEMETRIDEALPLGYTQMSVQTFHGFCDSLLRESVIHIGLDPAYKLMTTAESIDLLKRNLFALELVYFLPLGNPTKFLFGLLQHFSRLQDENITPTQYFEWAKSESSRNEKGGSEEKLESEKWLELARAYKNYEELKIKNSLMDFGDLITKAILLFNTRPNVLAEYQKRFKFILVDEFQDTNYAQFELVKFLSGKSANITVVGDDSQSIYRFRGAAISNILAFQKEFPQNKLVTLIKNYRSYQEILDTAYTLIQFNNPDTLESQLGISKKLVSVREGRGFVDWSLSARSDEEADFVTSKIIELQKKEKRNFNEFAILVRANSHADLFIRSFERAGIPFQFLGPGKLYLEEEIVDLVSYLNVVSDISDDAALYRLFSMPIWEIPPLDLARLSSRARRESKTLFDLSTSLSEDVSEETRTKIEKVTALISDHITRAPSTQAGELLYDFVQKAKIVEFLTKENSPDSVRKIENIAKFFSKIKSFEIVNQNSTIQNVVDWISLQQDLGESPQAAEIDWAESDAVNILTVHSAKGLEFPVVFLVNLVSLRFPSMNRHEQIPIPEDLIRETLPSGDYHLQEERRLFYVGLTRARDRLYLTASKIYGDAKREKKISTFVDEALGKGVSTRPTETKIKKEIENKVPPLVTSRIVKVKSLSYSQIETFKTCPMHYKLRYLLNVPTPPSSSQSFGISFHATLKEFEELVKSGESPSKSLLEKLLEKNWIAAGYMNAAHREESYKKALKFLNYYLDNYFDPDVKKLALEQPFNTRLNGLSLRGKIDRIDEVSGGIHIIDYKTGANIMTQKEADKSLQLSIYALAATRIHEPPFSRKPEDITLSLMYLDEPQIVTTHRTASQLEEAVAEIYEWKEKIETSDFACSKGFLCLDCEYKMYCKSENSS